MKSLQNIMIGFILSSNLVYAGICGRYQTKVINCTEVAVKHTAMFDTFVMMLEEMDDVDADELLAEFKAELVPAKSLLSLIKTANGQSVDLSYNESCDEVLVQTTNGLESYGPSSQWNVSKKGRVFSKEEYEDLFWTEEFRNFLRMKGGTYEEIEIKKKGKRLVIKAFQQLKMKFRVLFVPIRLNERANWTCELEIH